MYTKWFLLAAAPLTALATLLTTPQEAKAQYYYSPWYSYYSYYPNYYGGWPGYWGGYSYSPYWYGPRYAAPTEYRSFYSEPQDNSASNSTSAFITVEVPANAELWFGNVLTRQQGTERSFVSPPLQSGPYVYDLRARWTENGQPVERTKQVKVRAGERTRASFLDEKVPLAPEPAAKVKTTPPPAVEKP
jgi:uncharacterized protein (TIGR03000 family)